MDGDRRACVNSECGSMFDDTAFAQTRDQGPGHIPIDWDQISTKFLYQKYEKDHLRCSYPVRESVDWMDKRDG